MDAYERVLGDAMAARESGMPEEAYWETLFDLPLILDRLEVDGRVRNVWSQHRPCPAADRVPFIG